MSMSCLVLMVLLAAPPSGTQRPAAGPQLEVAVPVYLKDGTVLMSQGAPVMALGYVTLFPADRPYRMIDIRLVDVERTQAAIELPRALAALDKNPHQGETCPAVEFVDESGHPGMTPDDTGTYVLLQVWSSW
jgi:hypothetical protein